MPSRLEEIREALKSLSTGTEGIQACMVAKEGLEGVVMFPENFKQEISEIWGPVSQAMNHVLAMISVHSECGLQKVFIELLGYGIAFHVLSVSDTALIVFIPKRKNIEPAETYSKNIGKIDAARDKIMEIES